MVLHVLVWKMADCVLKLSAGSILNMNTNLVTYWLNDKNNDLMIKTMIELGIYIADQLFTSAASVRQILLFRSARHWQSPNYSHQSLTSINKSCISFQPSSCWILWLSAAAHFEFVPGDFSTFFANNSFSR